MSKIFTAASTEDGRFIQAAIDNAIRLKTQELIVKHKKEIERELENVVSSVVAQVSLRVASELNFQDTGKTIRFEINKRWEQTNE